MNEIYEKGKLYRAVNCCYLWKSIQTGWETANDKVTTQDCLLFLKTVHATQTYGNKDLWHQVILGGLVGWINEDLEKLEENEEES